MKLHNGRLHDAIAPAASRTPIAQMTVDDVFAKGDDMCHIMQDTFTSQDALVMLGCDQSLEGQFVVATNCSKPLLVRLLRQYADLIEQASA